MLRTAISLKFGGMAKLLVTNYKKINKWAFRICSVTFIIKKGSRFKVQGSNFTATHPTQ